MQKNNQVSLKMGESSTSKTLLFFIFKRRRKRKVEFFSKFVKNVKLHTTFTILKV